MIRYTIGDYDLLIRGKEIILNKKIGNSWEKAGNFSSLSKAYSRLLTIRRTHDFTDIYNNTINRGLEANITNGYIKKLERKRERLLSV